MKQQTRHRIRARLVRGAFYLLLLLLTVCVIPFAFAQRSTPANTTQPPTTSSDSSPGAAPGALAVPKFPTGGVLWDQYNNPATDPAIDIGSQDFEPAFDASDNQAVDDFVFTYPWNNCITGVRVLGEYSAGGGPASSFNVYFYPSIGLL